MPSRLRPDRVEMHPRLLAQDLKLSRLVDVLEFNPSEGDIEVLTYPSRTEI